MSHFLIFNAQICKNAETENVEKVAKGIKFMLTEYGFGAKTSSGFGVVDIKPQDVTVQPEPFGKQFTDAWEKDESASHNGGESNE